MIPVSEPNLDLKDAAALVEAIRNTQISGNSAIVAEFESMFAAYIGTAYGISCNSGASALHIALLSLGIGKGDEVLVPDLTMIATVNAVTYCGGTPVFIDSAPDTWCIAHTKLEDKITSNTKAIIPVHLYGHPCQMDEIGEIAKKYDLFIIEDAAEAIGSEYKGKKCGSFGDASCFSYYANKNITTGEGGMVVTDDMEIAEKCRALRSHAFGEKKDLFQHFNHTRLGFSYRLSGLQAALGVSQMERVEQLIEKKCNNGKFYNSFLKEIATNPHSNIEYKLTLPPQMPWVKNTYWYYTVLVNKSFGISRDELMKKLWADGIETRTTFIPMHRQQIYRQANGVFPVADLIADRGINLPSSSRLKAEEIMYICECIKKHATGN